MLAPAADQVAPAAGQIAPAGAQDAGDEVESDEDEEKKEQILRASLFACRKDEAKKEMLMLIKNGIKNGLWMRRLKVIENKDIRREAALILLDTLNFRSM